MKATYALRKQFDKKFKESIWNIQFSTLEKLQDPYGKNIDINTSSLDHIIPVKFFNTQLSLKENPAVFFERYKCAANCQENLQFLEKGVNSSIGARIHGKKNRHNFSTYDLISYLDNKYSLEIKKK